MGKREGEIKLDYPATSAVVIDDNTLAVAVNVAVVFVDTQTMKRIDSIPMGDNMHSDVSNVKWLLYRNNVSLFSGVASFNNPLAFGSSGVTSFNNLTFGG
jgi:hypothetical protein